MPLQRSMEIFITGWEQRWPVWENTGTDFRRFRNPTSKTQKALESCLYCLKLGGMPEEYEKAAIEMGVTREQQTFMDARYEEALRQSVDSRECKMVRRIRRMKEQGDPSYEKVAKELIFQWKTEYRKSMLP